MAMMRNFVLICHEFNMHSSFTKCLHKNKICER